MDPDYRKIMQDLQADKEYQKEVHRIVEKEFKELQKIGNNASQMCQRCRIGNSVVDYFTFDLLLLKI
jgi:hypothetical protein